MKMEKHLTSVIQFFENAQEEGYSECWDEDGAIVERDGYRFRIRDEWEPIEQGLRLKRLIIGEYTGGEIQEKGVRFGLRFPVPSGQEQNWRFCVPSMVYTRPEQYQRHERRTFMEDRLTGSMVLAYEVKTGYFLCLSKENPSSWTEDAVRAAGDSRYLQRTANISLGYAAEEDGTVCLESFWPYGEEDRSSALSSDERPAVAYYPLDGENFRIELDYRIEEGQNPSFAESVYQSYERLSDRLEQRGEEAVSLPFTVQESRTYRMESLEKSYREFGEKGAGFFFHFDPLYGYGSRPSGFSTCYDTIPHNSYTHILEYGFTGRQINAAYIMASEKGGKWLDRGERVIDFFLDHCQLDNGWLFSLYDLNTKTPFFSFGDPSAPKLHYISKTDKKGNYLRTMTEPMNDLLECYEWYQKKGRKHEEWLKAVLKYADFLIEHQNKDGSWYRAYCPDGEGTDAIDRPDQTGPEAEKGQKSVTAIPLVLLTGLCRCLEQEGKDGVKYQESARKAGEYVLGDMVREEHYQGATLDNPNQVDKEAAQYVMAGLLHLYLLTKEERYLDGAQNAAYIFMTWNYIWNAPMKKGTILYQKGFKTKGLGAINSVWGGGVVDIYSLFHIRELFWIGKLRKHPIMCKMAEWSASATAQILSYPGDSMGFADIGMQPEGFGICPQGTDEGMIQKGGIWGTLGWIYSAGIYGLNNYLIKKEEMENV